jgi:DNA modification methylase
MQQAQPTGQTQQAALNMTSVAPKFEVVSAKDLVVPTNSAPLPAPAEPVAVVNVSLSQTIVCADCRDFLPRVPDQSVNLVLTDWPYGIEMTNLDQNSAGLIDMDGVVDTHQVEDNFKLWDEVVPHFWRVLKDNSYAVVWIDFEHFSHTRALFEKQGFRVCRWPFIWVKTHPCLNTQANRNLTKNFEIALIAAKGSAVLASQGVSTMSASNEAVKQRFHGHPFVKPLEVWQYLLKRFSLEGDVVLDPFAGVGTSVASAIVTGRKPLACEISPEFHMKMLAQSMSTYRYVYEGRVTFS